LKLKKESKIFRSLLKPFVYCSVDVYFGRETISYFTHASARLFVPISPSLANSHSHYSSLGLVPALTDARARIGMGCVSSSTAGDDSAAARGYNPKDVTRAADVPCPHCRKRNYLNPLQESMECWSCGEARVTRHHDGATGVHTKHEFESQIAARKMHDVKNSEAMKRPFGIHSGAMQ
jgi:hypothetical protein